MGEKDGEGCLVDEWDHLSFSVGNVQTVSYVRMVLGAVRDFFLTLQGVTEAIPTHKSERSEAASVGPRASEVDSSTVVTLCCPGFGSPPIPRLRMRTNHTQSRSAACTGYF